ncbi:MAG: ABC transporter substrate-binding protein [Solirubrobacterales bacterium]
MKWSGYRPWAAVAALALTALLTGGCGGEDPADGNAEEPTPLVVTLPLPDSAFWAGYEIARGPGGPYDVDYGLEPTTEEAQDRTFALLELLAGEVDFVVTGAADAMIASARGEDVLGVATVHSGLSTIVATPRSGTRSVRDLGGRVIGVVNLSGGEVPLLGAALRAEGIDPEAVELRVVGNDQAARRALRRGEIAALAAPRTAVTLLRQRGIELEPILDDELADLPTDFLVIRPELEGDPAKLGQVLNLMKGWYEGTLYGEEFPQDSLQRICDAAPETCEEPGQARALLRVALSWSLQEAKSCGTPDIPALEAVQSLLEPEAPEVAEIDVSDVFVSTYSERMCPDQAVVDAFANRTGAAR